MCFVCHLVRWSWFEVWREDLRCQKADEADGELWWKLRVIYLLWLAGDVIDESKTSVDSNSIIGILFRKSWNANIMNTKSTENKLNIYRREPSVLLRSNSPRLDIELLINVPPLLKPDINQISNLDSSWGATSDNFNALESPLNRDLNHISVFSVNCRSNKVLWRRRFVEEVRLRRKEFIGCVNL